MAESSVPHNAVRPECEPYGPLAPILSSAAFERSGTLKRLLIYLWEHRQDPISEYAIATEALDRPQDFDSKVDATVRVQISRLRQKLKEFYASEGQNCPTYVVIPLGSHVLEVSSRETEAPSQQEETPKPTFADSKLLYGLTALCVVLLIATIWMGWRVVSERNASPKTSAEHFWQGFLGGPQHTIIILPTPAFFSFKSPETSLLVRDLAINDFAEWNNSSELRELKKRYGDAQLQQFYTVQSDTFAAIALARYFDSSGLGERVDFVDSGTMPMGALEKVNEIAFGAYATLHPFRPYLDRMNFYMAEYERYVGNRHPLGAEPATFPLQKENGEQRSIQPCLLAVLPGRSRNTRLMILQAKHTAALVTFLTSSTGVDSLQKMWKTNGSPQYYEVVVYAEMNGDQLMRAWPVALRPFNASVSD